MTFKIFAQALLLNSIMGDVVTMFMNYALYYAKPNGKCTTEHAYY